MMNCVECQDFITPHIDNELDEKTKKEVESHLNICEKCRNLYKSEQVVKLAIKKNFNVVSAPDDLKKSIKNNIDFSSDKRSIFSYKNLTSFHPLLKYAAAAVLVIAAVSIFMINPFQKKEIDLSHIHLPDDFTYVSESENLITLEGEVICVCCEMHKKGAHANCRRFGHTYGIKTDNGVLWTIMKNDSGIKLIDHKELIGSRIRLTGGFYFNSNYIDLDRFEPITHAKMNPDNLALKK